MVLPLAPIEDLKLGFIPRPTLKDMSNLPVDYIGEKVQTQLRCVTSLLVQGSMPRKMSSKRYELLMKLVSSSTM